MPRLRLPAGGHSRATATNLAAQGGALAAVTISSLLVARSGGPTVLGEYALLRILPWLFGVVLSCGLPVASAFHLAGARDGAARLRATLLVMLVVSAVGGMGIWIVSAGVVRGVLLHQLALWQVAVATPLVATQLITVTGKACCQGREDIAGSNLIIVAEEAWFVVTYPAVVFFVGLHGVDAVLAALVSSGALAAVTAWARLARKGFLHGLGAPSQELARTVLAYGSRAQAGNLLWLMNLRFDVLLLAALGTPTQVGVYVVATKVGELMRLIPTAVNYVCYPRYAGLGPLEAGRDARHLAGRAAILTTATTPFVALAAIIGLPLIYGKAFSGAVAPALLIVAGLAPEGSAAVASAFLCGQGRPGLNSVGMAAGAAVTVACDVVLIPVLGIVGAGLTSGLAYLTATGVLTLMMRRTSAPAPAYPSMRAALS
jgi:O-antigen/teichoic acid export membrane protein